MSQSHILHGEKKIPMMFRAQIKGRSQLHFIDKKKEEQDSERWVSEWIDKINEKAPQWSQEVHTKTYTFSWRFVTNGGQDEGIIRPVMGAYGLPFYPGSSMKGIFVQACSGEQKQRYRLTKNGDEPSLLRFHGGYPVNKWKERLLDLVHPQQGWQVKTINTKNKPSGDSAYALISLYEPTFEFGISSLLPNTDWDEIWQIWEKALGYGLGCRVSSGYGLPKARLEGQEEIRIATQGKVLHKCYLTGQGQAPTLINDESGEFRPNIFRSAIRGHALRLFGGLTNARTAEDLVDTLLGGIQGEGKQGLLAIAFTPSSLTLEPFTQGYDEPTYQVTGELRWLLTQPLEDTQQQCLSKLISLLVSFGMLLGGFGKSWRRADHRLFYPNYYEKEYKPLIGCHWEWEGSSLIRNNKVRSLNHVAPFIEDIRTTAKEWMRLQGVILIPNEQAFWREAWSPNNVQVWGRIAEDKEDSLAIKWLHQPYQQYDRYLEQVEQSIKKTSVAGSIGQVGRLWHRMYPLVRLVPNRKDPKQKKVARKTPQYIELLTIFPDDSADSQNFLEFLDKEAQLTSSQQPFQKFWGG